MALLLMPKGGGLESGALKALGLGSSKVGTCSDGERCLELALCGGAVLLDGLPLPAYVFTDGTIVVTCKVF